MAIPIMLAVDVLPMTETATLLLRRVSGPAAAPALALLAAGRNMPDSATPPSTDGTVYAMVDVAAPDADPVGAALVIGPSPNGTAELTALFVAPPFRGQGLGGRILGEVVDVLRGQGVVRVAAVIGDNGVARRLCERAGFRVLDPAGTHLSVEL